jgi:hypothetical protein
VKVVEQTPPSGEPEPAAGSDPPPIGTGPRLGVIREAKQRERRRLLTAATLGVAMLAGLGAWLTGHTGAWTSRRDGSAHAAFERARELRRRRGSYVSPALEGGSYGWALIEPNGGSCCTVPRMSPHRVPIGVLAGWTSNTRSEAATALLDDAVTEVRAKGEAARVVTLTALPYHLRLARIELRRHAQSAFAEGAPPLQALNSSGRPLGTLSEDPGISGGDRWWQRPESPPAGPCQLHATGVPGIEAECGHVATTLRPYPGSIIGRAFFSCVDTEYYLHNWPLETAILLDAQHPGRTPAPIPRMKSVPGAHGVFSAPGDWHGELTATRHGHAWLVVAGGSGPTQRIQVLRHLSMSIALPHR